MAYVEKYSKEELARLEELKKRAVAEAELKKEKKVVEEEARKEIVDTRGGDYIDPIDPVEPDKDDPRERPDPTGGVTTVETVKVKETRAMPIVTDSDDFTLTYTIEPIPRPDINKIYGLNINDKNIFDKQYWGLDRDDGKFKVHHKLKNFMNKNGGPVNVSVNGVLGTPFKVVVYNETDNTYYNPNPIDGTTGFRNGFNTIQGVVKRKKRLDQEGETKGEVEGSFDELFTSQNPQDYEEKTSATNLVSFVIPPSNTEKVYKISLFKELDVATYDESVPLYGVEEKPPFIITQLPDPKTTIKFEDDDNFMTATGDLEINHTPYAKLDSNIYTKGQYTLDLSITSRRQLSLNTNLMGNKLRGQNINNATSGVLGTDEYTQTQVKKIDLTASIVNNIGYVKGTIDLGKACYRTCELLINPSSVFTLDNDIK